MLHVNSRGTTFEYQRAPDWTTFSFFFWTVNQETNTSQSPGRVTKKIFSVAQGQMLVASGDRAPLEHSLVIHMISLVYVANLTSNLPAWQQESHSEPLGEKVLQLPSWQMAGFLLVGFRLQWHATVGKIKDKLKNLSRYKAGRSWFSIFNVCVLTQFFRCLCFCKTTQTSCWFITF